MKMILFIMACSLFSAVGQEMPVLIRKAGSYQYPTNHVRITFREVGKYAMEVRMSFDGKDSGGTVGTGEGSPMRVDREGWAAQYIAPNELWLYDGLGQLRLYERTAHGFKGSNSSSVPTLLDRAPRQLRDHIEKHREIKKKEGPNI